MAKTGDGMGDSRPKKLEDIISVQEYERACGPASRQAIQELKAALETDRFSQGLQAKISEYYADPVVRITLVLDLMSSPEAAVHTVEAHVKAFLTILDEAIAHKTAMEETAEIKAMYDSQ